ncbi:hypothetical protein EVAR_68518_1 [Eumeta japonica]|uniref:Uncharacterized protein n=1 Tax=Eumeta variegata TaxID=151549 RepID=A0A4C1ZB77_EUMVA|nr:hypothetical protein EVAR_68518_1 [Eumeta japonica]
MQVYVNTVHLALGPDALTGRRVQGAAETSTLALVQRTKLCRSELFANDAMHSFNVPRPYLLLPRGPVSRYRDAFMINFTAAGFRALYCTPRLLVDRQSTINAYRRTHLLLRSPACALSIPYNFSFP